MGEFRIGRTHAQHAYPEPPTGSALLLLARNFADTNPAQSIPDTGVAINWNRIDIGAVPANSVSITPKSTGKLIVKGVIVIENTDVGDHFVVLEGLRGGAVQPLPASDKTTIPAGATVSIPFLAEYTGVVGVATTVGIQATSDPGAAGVATVTDASSLSVQEVVEATG